jgi:hypothetical protein
MSELLEVQDSVVSSMGHNPKGTSGAMHVLNVAVEPGQSSTFDRTWGGGLAKTTSLSADGQIGAAGPCVFYGYLVTTIVGAGVINIRDATSAGTGTIIEIVAAAAAVGTQEIYPVGIYCANGCYADFASTGTVTFYYQQV